MNKKENKIQNSDLKKRLKDKRKEELSNKLADLWRKRYRTELG